MRLARWIPTYVVLGLVVLSFGFVLSRTQFPSIAGEHENEPGHQGSFRALLRYPLYIIPLLGMTHILGGVGLLIPNVPRLTEWVYAGLAINLLLAFYSQLNGSGSTWDKSDPILVMVFVFASYVLRRRMRANRWSI
jgi:hypothetical protein